LAYTLEIPQAYLAAAPVVVTSPTTRCGTTLVQRLLCASDNGFVYGEEIGNQFRNLAGLFATQIKACDQNGQAMDDAFALALAGGLRDWRPGLTPPAKIVLNAWADVFYQFPVGLAVFGEAIGRPVWGFKWPGCQADTLRTYLTLMPRTKVVYVLRNVVDALKSAKARRFVTSTEGAEGFCAEWARNVAGLAALAGDPQLLVIKYEDLIEDRETVLAALSDFTGVRNMRRSEFDLKVNTFEGQEEAGHSPTQYIAPEELTEADWAVLRAQAGAMMAEHYPAFLPA